MKIIDKTTGKRVGAKDSDVKAHSKKLKEEDPILRNAAKNDESDEISEEYSAMDPPNAYDNDRVVGSNYDAMDSFLQELMDEHKEVIEKTAAFDNALIKFKTNGFQFEDEINKAFNEFFVYFDDHILPHNRKEERRKEHNRP